MKCPCLRIINILPGGFSDIIKLILHLQQVRWPEVTLMLQGGHGNCAEGKIWATFCAPFFELRRCRLSLNTWHRKGAVLYSTSVSVRRHCGPRIHPRGWMFPLDVHLVIAACVWVSLNVSKDYIKNLAGLLLLLSVFYASFPAMHWPCFWMNKSELEPFVWFPLLILIFF